jgi:hypothetical protein
MSNGPKYDHAAAAAAQIINLDLGPDQLRAEVFGKILFIVLDSMYAAERELNAQRFEPSSNCECDKLPCPAPVLPAGRAGVRRWR